jgi:hypothetical protein
MDDLAFLSEIAEVRIILFFAERPENKSTPVF